MKKTKPEKSDKQQIGVLVDRLLWRKFKGKCIGNGITAGKKIEELFQEYLKEK